MYTFQSCQNVQEWQPDWIWSQTWVLRKLVYRLIWNKLHIWWSKSVYSLLNMFAWGQRWFCSAPSAVCRDLQSHWSDLLDPPYHSAPGSADGSHDLVYVCSAHIAPSESNTMMIIPILFIWFTFYWFQIFNFICCMHTTFSTLFQNLSQNYCKESGQDKD